MHECRWRHRGPAGRAAGTFRRHEIPTIRHGQNELALPVEGTKAYRDLVYARRGARRMRLDLYVPPAAQPVPVVIWLHGGAWLGGNKRWAPLEATRWALAVASVNYRLSWMATFPAPLHDVTSAVAWLRAGAERWHLAGDRIGAWGASAGGHLAALAGLTAGQADLTPPDQDDPRAGSVQCVVSWSGPTDLGALARDAGPGSPIDHDAPDSPQSRLIGRPIAERPDLAAAASPITYAHPGAPPMLLVQGREDDIVPPVQSERLYEALRHAGCDATLHMVDGAGHALPHDRCLPQSAAFLAKHLGAEGLQG